MKVRKIIASILTFMMLFMNVPTNVFATEGVIINSDYTFKTGDAIDKIYKVRGDNMK